MTAQAKRTQKPTAQTDADKRAERTRKLQRVRARFLANEQNRRVLIELAKR